MNDLAKPAAPLTTTRVKRSMSLETESVVAPSPRPQPFAADVLRLSPRGEDDRRAAESVHVEDAGRPGSLRWRRAGLFGIVYVCALLFFAAAFDVWTVVLDR